MRNKNFATISSKNKWLDIFKRIRKPIFEPNVSISVQGLHFSKTSLECYLGGWFDFLQKLRCSFPKLGNPTSRYWLKRRCIATPNWSSQWSRDRAWDKNALGILKLELPRWKIEDFHHLTSYRSIVARGLCEVEELSCGRLKDLSTFVSRKIALGNIMKESVY